MLVRRHYFSRIKLISSEDASNTGMPSLGLSSLYVTLFDHPLESFLGDIHHHQLGAAEVVNFKSTVLNNHNIAALKKTNGVKLTVHSALDTSSDICNPHSDARQTALRKLKQSIDDAVDIGAVGFVQHPGTKTFDIENGRELNSESMLELIDYGNSRGIKVLIENMAPTKSFMSSPSEFMEFIKTNNVNLDMAFDTGHAHMAGNIDEFIQQLASHFFLVHITDNDGANDAHLNVGEGTIDWKRLIGGLLKQRFSGSYIVEAVKDPMNSIDSLKELLK
jgi:sugar phosphate isomerase/epimerase